jgi:hypothetical protein
MSKYRVVKEYRPMLGKVMHVVERKWWFFWIFVSFEFSQEMADDLIKHLKNEGL